MAGLSERVEARLRELSAKFAEQLPERVAAVSDAARVALSDDSSEASLQELRHCVHKLAGSAGTFGFHHLSAAAKRLEHLVDEILAGDGSPKTDDLRQVRMSVSDLSEAARLNLSGTVQGSDDELEMLEPDEDLPSQQPQQHRQAVSTGPRTVALAIDGALAADLEQQLEFYGLSHQRIDLLRELEPLMAEHAQAAVVLDAAVVTSDPTTAEELGRIKRSHEHSLHIACISDRDDFETRLLAVRAGGEAFYTRPVDVGRLVDKLDGLTSIDQDEPHHVLIVDDDVEQVAHTALILQQAGMITSVATDPRNVFSVLIESKPELILMDMYMPGCSGLELATLIRQQEAFVGIPIVFLSVETDIEKQMNAIDHGGDGFLTKPIKPEHLIASVRLRVERSRSMRYFMECDSLTGLFNHTHLKQTLSKEIQRAERIGRSVSFAMIDIDHFKEVNDTYGHLTGDRVLKGLAHFLAEQLRKTDTVGRYGGEEFGIVLFDVDAEAARTVMNKIRDGFGKIVHSSGDATFSVTFSCGIATFPTFDGPGPVGQAADNALYSAKRSGRNRVVVADPLRTGSDQSDRQ